MIQEDWENKGLNNGCKDWNVFKSLIWLWFLNEKENKTR